MYFKLKLGEKMNDYRTCTITKVCPTPDAATENLSIQAVAADHTQAPDLAWALHEVPLQKNKKTGATQNSSWPRLSEMIAMGYPYFFFAFER